MQGGAAYLQSQTATRELPLKPPLACVGVWRYEVHETLSGVLVYAAQHRLLA